MKLKYQLEYGLLRTSYFIINLLPLFLINAISRMISWLAWIFFPFRLGVAYDNISTVFPELDHHHKLKLVRDAYHWFIRAAGLIFVIHRKKVSSLIDQTVVTGLELLDEAISENKGVILTTYHGCWFEAYFAWFSRNHRPTSLIYQQQNNSLCDDFFVKLRQRYGANLTHIHSLEKLSVYLQALAEKRILIVSLDQNYTDNGTQATLFNKKFTCARGTALFHLKTGSPILTSVYYMKDGLLHIDFERVDLPKYDGITDENIQQISNLSLAHYEKTIRAYPSQWFSLFHRLWKKEGYPSKVPRSFKEIIS